MMTSMQKKFSRFILIGSIILFSLAMQPCFGQRSSSTKQHYDRFHVGQTWLDSKGDTINAHGGNIVYYKNTYYWFGEKRDRHHSLGVSVYSSKDLYNWKPEGLALAHSKDTTSDIAFGGIMERPKVVYNKKTKQFVMWFHVEVRGKGYGAAKVGVAVSKHITGPYQFIRSFRPNGNMSRDMTIFVDDNGSAYEIYSSRENYDLRIVRLTDDYLNVTTKDSLLFAKHREAPAIFKYQKKYYLITSGCTGWAPNAAALRVADNLYGPWKLLGNPLKGKDSNISFYGQPTYFFPVPASSGRLRKKSAQSQSPSPRFIYMADRWNPKNLKDSRYQFLPVTLTTQNEMPIEIKWQDSWQLN
jgi:beta-galactosidase